MAFNLVIFGNSNRIDVKNYNCLEMFNTKEKYEEIYDLADWKCEYNKFSIQATSTCPLTIEIKYSNYPFPTKANKPTKYGKKKVGLDENNEPVWEDTELEVDWEEAWFDVTTIEVPGDRTPMIKDVEFPFCRFLKYTVTPSYQKSAEYCSIVTISS